ncbi:Retrovirus-related Pol poly from [Labeo rohita]|uniref:Retrovirus-related Pol poly from n=1 Tax=Labeo rohita TaxID=84645 RepID=A0A498P2B2_LABRO|nr:Retrovirus-related Pol poly from [Labeo rohita]
MASTPPSPSTSVEIEPPPDVATPVWPPVQLRPIPPPLIPTFHFTPTQFSSPQPRSQVHFATTPPSGTVSHAPTPMQLCTSASDEASPPSSVTQHDLPGYLPTPGREIHQLTAHVQGNWDTVFEHMQTHEKTVGELTQGLKATSAHHDTLIAQLADKMEHNQKNVLSCISKNKEDVKEEIDQLVKSVKIDISAELYKAQTTFVSEVRFMMEQLQGELQQDIKTYLVTLQRNHDQMSTELTQCTQTTKTLCITVQDLQTEIEKKFNTLESQMAGLQREDPSSPPSSAADLPAIPVSGPAPLPGIKSDHLKLTFPTFGRRSDDADPLLYLTRCQDFLALHPLTDVDILATFRSVLYGTARDWWEVARSSIKTWNEFESAFLSAFLSEDYEDELAERVRTRTQGERESIRDFAFTYRALCKRWKPTLTDSELVKMILKNIKPYLASQLRSRVSNVDELVKLGQQLERDYEQQQQYEGRMSFKQSTSMPQRPISNRPAEKEKPPLVQCWRCKGHHSPGHCPHFVSAQSLQSSQPYSSNSKRTTFPVSKAGGLPTSHSVSATWTKKTSTGKQTSLLPAIPQQLVVPLSIGTWKGKAIVDTGASYTLLHENLCKELIVQSLPPWTRGPLYLANGEAEIPLGWVNIPITLHNKVFNIPAAVLPAKALAYAVVLGLDFIFSSGLQINVADQKYSFKSSPKADFPFQPGNASVPVIYSQHKKGKKERKSSSLSLLSSVPPPQIIMSLSPANLDEKILIDAAVNAAHLLPEDKQQLRPILESNPQVCTLRPGRTKVLEHHIYTTYQVPIMQRPYRTTPAKQAVIKKQLEEMLAAGIVEPSHSGWASPVVLVPKKDGSLRFCVDYRKINASTENDAYPLPNITEILESLSGASVFSTIDLNSGYWQTQAMECCKRAQKRQLRNYNKNRRDSTYKEKDRVWMRNYPQSSAQHHFTAKLAQKWKGPYRILKQVGPVNYRISLESTGEDVRTVHVCNLKPCFPSAAELENQEKKKILEIFNESSEEEEFLGF